MKDHQRINADSGNVEYHTPIEIIEAARRTMGGIDLDPASSAKANEIVKAKRFYGIADDGLAQPWAGRVWMNHPFGKTIHPKAGKPEQWRKGARLRLAASRLRQRLKSGSARSWPSLNASFMGARITDCQTGQSRRERRKAAL